MERDGDDTRGQTPLRGVVLCCTSLTTDVRTKVADVAAQMGAVHKLDLTADVTHLVVGNVNTAKYQYVAKDRPDIKVLAPAWIDAVRDAWMEGGDVDVAGLEERHRLPTFYDLHICVTGFDDMEQRSYISRTVEEQGASYHGDLTKQITHLVAAAPQGAKYIHAKQWGLKVVSLRWFADSLARGMALDESLYDPTMPSEEQGKGAFRTLETSRTNLGKRIRDSNIGAGVGEEPGKKKLRRTASTRLESQSQDMWSQLSSREGAQTHAEVDRWQDDSVSEVTSKVPITEGMTTDPDGAKAASRIQDAPQGLFCGCFVLILGFDDKRSQLLHSFLQPNGAKILHSPDQLENASLHPSFRERFLIIPHAESDVAPPDVPPGTKVVTEWWVERCVHTKRLLDPAVDVLSRSLSNIHIPGFSKLSIVTTGFEGYDFRQIAQAVRMIGATYQENGMDKDTSVIISGTATMKREKALYAHKYNLPVVKADWLWACINEQSLASFEKFRLGQPASHLVGLDGEAAAASPSSSDGHSHASGDEKREKGNQLPKRLSNIRKRHATPSLPLQSAPSPVPTVARPPPIVHEDEDTDGGSIDTDVLPPLESAKPSQRRPHPLQEVSPNLSPRKSGHSQDEKEVVEISSKSVGKPPSRTVSPEKDVPANTDDLGQQPSEKQTLEPTRPSRAPGQLTADLHDLLLRQTASRPGSASGSVAPNKRKNRPLGRAPSGISNRSLSASAHSETLSQNPDAAVDGFMINANERLPPSTQLGYETADAEAYRLQMSKKMGMTCTDEDGLQRVARVGTVKDSSLNADAGVGNRVRGRQRVKS